MSIVKRHDVIQTSLLLKSANKDLAKLEDGKTAWTDFQWKERDLVLKKLHAKEVNAVRQHANLAVDHQKMLKAEFTETMTIDFGEAPLTDKKAKGFLSDHGKLMTFREEPVDPEKPTDSTDWYNIFCMNPDAFAGFRALKEKYQYFKFNKISVKFVANTANNLSPIICRYLPPMPKIDNATTYGKQDIASSFITKYAESAGTNYGFLSVHCPPYLLKKGEYVKGAAEEEEVFNYGKDGYCMGNLCRDRAICDYMDYNQYIDYGYLIFETRNKSAYQSAVIQIHYYIDFYTGYDFEAAAYGVTFGPGDDDGGNGGDDNDDGKDDGEQEIPDSTSTGPQPKGGMVRKSYKKQGH